MLLQESTEKQTEVLDEVLLIVFPVGVGEPNVGVQGQHLRGYGTDLSLIVTAVDVKLNI